MVEEKAQVESPLEKGQFILFSSEMNHYIGKNQNKDFWLIYHLSII